MGTTELQAAGASSLGLQPSEFTRFGDKVLFQGVDASNAHELWVTDGTAAGTTELRVSGTGAGSNGGLSPSNLFQDNFLFYLPRLTAALFDDTGVFATDGVTADPDLSGTGDAGLVVTVTENGAVVGTGMAAADGRWRVSIVGLQDGDHSLLVSQTNAVGTGTASVLFKLDTAAIVPQALGLTVAKDGSGATVTNSSKPTIFGTAAAWDMIFLSANGQADGGATVFKDGTWQAPVATPLAIGINTITATSSDLAGNVSEAATLEVTVLPTADPNGVTTVAMTSTELAQAGPRLQVTVGTRAIVLVDGTLSLSPETDTAFVARLYECVLGREPDTVGLGSWTTQLAHGASQADIATSFLNSVEFTAGRLGAGTDEQFLTALYQQALGRDPDGPGFVGWSGSLQAGATSRADVCVCFAASTEAEQHWGGLTASLWAPTPNADFVRSIYNTGLGREAEAAGLEQWKNLLDSGVSWQDFARDMGQADEFQSRHSGQTNEQFVFDLYQSGLGRAPEPAGMASWVDNLQTGRMTRGDVLFGVAASQEAMTHLAYSL